MTPAEIHWIRQKLALSQRDLALLLDETLTTVARWESGKSQPRELSSQLISQLIKSYKSNPDIMRGKKISSRNRIRLILKFLITSFYGPNAVITRTDL